jgi:hypothetical protein
LSAATEIFTTAATVVAATPAAIQVAGQIKDKVSKKELWPAAGRPSILPGSALSGDRHPRRA